MTLTLATEAPPFELPGVDGSTHSLDDYERAGPRRCLVVQPLSVRARVGGPDERDPAGLR